MRKLYLGLGLSFLGIGIYVITAAVRQEYYSAVGPGPGFFPFWLGVILTGLAFLWLIQIVFMPADSDIESFLPDGAGRYRILSVLGGLAFYVLAADTLGFRITTFLFLLFVLLVLKLRSGFIAVAVAAVGSFGVYFLFHDLLGVYLPVTSIEFLEKLGV